MLPGKWPVLACFTPLDRESRSDLATLLARSRVAGNGVYIGMTPSGMAFAPRQHGVLVLGPPRAGKTTAIVVPNVLAADGPVVAVSTKRDVLESTAPTRRALGRVLLFDPSGEIPPPAGVEAVGWSPLLSARRWDRAVITAESMVGASRGSGTKSEQDHWNERSAALLACAFHSAALDDSTMDDVVSAVNRRDLTRMLATLSKSDSTLALDLLVGIAETDSREQSGIFSTASGVLAAYRTEAALYSARLRPIDPDRFVTERSTLYVATSADHQRHVAPIIAGLVRDLRSAAYGRSGQVGSPLLLVLDELANIAPLHDLPTLVAEGGSQGVVTLACLQDLSQARSRWGVAADGFFTLFGTKIVLPGLGDTRTLEVMSVLAGEVDSPSISISSPRRGPLRRATKTIASRRERLLSPHDVAVGEPGTAIVVVGATIGRVKLTPAYQEAPFRRLVAHSAERAVTSARILQFGARSFGRRH